MSAIVGGNLQVCSDRIALTCEFITPSPCGKYKETVHRTKHCNLQSGLKSKVNLNVVATCHRQGGGTSMLGQIRPSPWNVLPCTSDILNPSRRKLFVWSQNHGIKELIERFKRTHAANEAMETVAVLDLGSFTLKAGMPYSFPSDGEPSMARTLHSCRFAIY